jgi:hypothetical protein
MMYYEERVIQSFLHWRDTPDGEFQPFTKTMLQDRVNELEDRLAVWREMYYEMREMFNQQ